MKRGPWGQRGMIAGLMVFGLAATTPARAQTADADTGHTVAKRWCVSCHQVDPEDPATGVAPSFQMLANTNKNESAWLRAWRREPHPRLQGVVFTPFQADALAAYLKSFKAE